MTEKKTARELWQNYAFLTREIGKFVSKHDWDLVSELINQRNVLQRLIEEVPDDGYKATKEGNELLQTIRNDNQVVTDVLQRLYNHAHRNQEVSRAYDQIAGSYSGFSGSFMDRQS